MPKAMDVLLAQGHNTTDAGVCEKCWREAASLYAGGGYESHAEAYYTVLDAAMARAQADVRLAAREEAPGA